MEVFCCTVITVLLMLQMATANGALESNLAFASLNKTPFSICQTNGYMICEDEFVLVGVCLTRLNNDSNTAVYGACPLCYTSQHL